MTKKDYSIYIGKTFNRLTVLSYFYKNKKTYFVCSCSCGNETTPIAQKVLSGWTKSCGCYKNDSIKRISIKHGMYLSRLYSIRKAMIGRCYNKNRKGYENYGGRGITVCSEWKNDFKSFYNWAIKNGYTDDLTIDRIDVNGNYCPENCRWATRKEQARNKRDNHFLTHNCETKCIKDWYTQLGVSCGRFYKYLEENRIEELFEKYGI